MSQYRKGAERDLTAVALHTGLGLRVVRRMNPRDLESHLARMADSKPDGASMAARREGIVDPGVQSERAYLATLGLARASVKIREAALAERALEQQRSED